MGTNSKEQQQEEQELTSGDDPGGTNAAIAEQQIYQKATTTPEINSQINSVYTEAAETEASAIDPELLGVEADATAVTVSTGSTWTSPEGLVYGIGGREGNRVAHVLKHLVPDSDKAIHSLFNVDSASVLQLIDSAWARRVLVGVGKRNDVYIANLGYLVGSDGETSIKIVVEHGTNNIVTAYPVK